MLFSDEIEISDIEEVNEFLDLNISLFAKEVDQRGLADSKVLKFVQLCLEICHQNCRDEFHSINDLTKQEGATPQG